MNIEEIEKAFLEYINTHKGISTKFGEIELNKSNRIGQGGNGLVYLGKINRKDVAVKFLISDSKRKISRFKSEFFNVNYVRNGLHNIVNMIHYDELKINNEIVIPYIIMDSPYAELPWNEHRGKGQHGTMHDLSKTSEIDRPVFGEQKKQYWIERARIIEENL